MFLLFTILSAAGHVAHYIFSAYTWVVIISALITWVRPDPYNPIVRTLRALTEPVFWRVRRYLPFTYINGLDLSPVVVILALQFLDIILVRCVGYLELQLRILGA
ncbi:YggT family protein [Desulfovibrio sp. OttesenSCG-928-I05]|nr:YggT family protein [Desulfovibrio sp. OttesenSCG-928-I05]